MRFRYAIAAALFALAAPAAGGPAGAATLRWSFQGPLASLDPYSLNETFTLSTLGNVYEGLTRRGAKLEMEPGLAERWETLDPKHWRFHLRKNVKFQNGEPFTADDVLFSAERVRAKGSDLTTRIPADAKFEKVDDYTVDVRLATPAPTLPNEWDTWYIMSKSWAEKNNAVNPVSASDKNPNYAAYHANGTGPFVIDSHEPGVRTVMKPNPQWWDKRTHNIDEAVLTTVKADPTRVAALLSGEVDWVDPVPVQDVQRVNANKGTKVLSEPELRTIFLGFNQMGDELKSSNVKGKNPFKDVRVRRAFFQAIDIEAIKSKVMRGLAAPAALPISPLLFSRAGEFHRLPHDPAAAKKLLEEAGYPNGFEVTMDCPNDRYVNDEQICQAVVAMLARIGVKVNLLAQTKSKYFAKVLASGGYDTDFYLLGWTPSGFDSLNVLDNIVGCRDAAGHGGMFNLGGYCNPKVTELTNRIRVESDKTKRDDLIAQAYRITTDEVALIPLHQQALVWGVSDKLELVQRADNTFMIWHVTKKE